ncbi:multicopper oxidase family protein [Qaidamihabitans albus]|uniref:multicopper oxidase family protein n=1 Tax=Qaidamihabitans albus TaxID=2795733 RepID=UPI0027DCDB8F|nr:multicopper oxidase domain-containing protein [Qaidamihabitans albus]
MKTHPSPPRHFWRRRGLFGKLLLIGALALVPFGAFFGAVFTVAYQDARQSNLGELTFGNPVAVPPVLEPTVDAQGRKHFDLRLRTGRSELLPGHDTETWGVNGAHLGPTLRASTGDRVVMHVTNDLPEASTLHWHGMRLPARTDGGPHQEIAPGETWSPQWTIRQPGASLWYHPHPHGHTAEHVYRGVSGMFLLDDPESGRLDLPGEYGVDDVPLIIQDKRFDEDGELDFSRASSLAGGVGAGATGILGDEILVNGTHDPHFEVSRTLTRLRVLNASPARVYNLGFDDGRDFRVIGTDSGLLPVPAPRDRVVVSPGERVELVVRLAPGESPVLRSFPGGLGAGFPGDRFAGGDDTFDLIQLRAPAGIAPSPGVPAELSRGEPPEPRPGAPVRRFDLGGRSINGKKMDMSRVDEVVSAGATEVWEIRGGRNPHSFHIHDVAFRILDIGGEPPPSWLAGRKDTVYVPPGEEVRLVVEFGTDVDPEVPYMYHCHLLYHEDKGMMGQFVIVPPGREDSVPRTLRTGGHDHG